MKMMKNFIHLMVFLVLGTMPFFSCSKDEGGKESAEEVVKKVTVDASDYGKWAYFKFSDQSVVAHPIEPIAGVYKGELNVTVMGKSFGKVKDLNLTLERGKEKALNVKLAGFTMGKYKIEEIVAPAKDTVDMKGWGIAIQKVKVNGMDVLGKGLVVAGKSVTLNLKVQPPGMPMPFDIAYTGTLEKSANIDESSFEWDIALHAYDVKTNEGEALETTEKNLADIKAIPLSGFTKDVETDSLIVDRKFMMMKRIGYAPAHLNPVLKRWMKLDFSVMPPLYNMSGLVYLVKTKSGEYAKIKFTGFRNDENKSGHISFEYVYPVSMKK